MLEAHKLADLIPPMNNETYIKLRDESLGLEPAPQSYSASTPCRLWPLRHPQSRLTGLALWT